MTVPVGMVVVSREEFFARIGPRDICPRCEPDYTEWETRNRLVVGRTVPGWRTPGDDKVYMLSVEHQ